MVREPYRLAFFMPPARFLDILARVASDEDVAVVLQRFKSGDHEAGVHVLPPGEDLEATHREGRFGPIYLSIGGLPRDETDWNFIERSRSDLIDIKIGATAPGQIALSEVYRAGDSDRLQAVFEALERAIAANSHRGVRGERHAYPDHYWSEEVRPLALYRALGKDASRYWIDEG